MCVVVIGGGNACCCLLALTLLLFDVVVDGVAGRYCRLLSLVAVVFVACCAYELLLFCSSFGAVGWFVV